MGIPSCSCSRRDDEYRNTAACVPYQTEMYHSVGQQAPTQQYFSLTLFQYQFIATSQPDQQCFSLTPFQHQLLATSQPMVFFSHTTPAPAQQTKCMCVSLQGSRPTNQYSLSRTRTQLPLYKLQVEMQMRPASWLIISLSVIS